MDKDVLITISGLMYAGDDHDSVDVIAPGQYYYRRGRHYLVYEEPVEESQEIIHNLVWISPEEMVVRKSGVISTEMCFRPNQDTVTHYSTPYGAVEMGIHTKRLQIRETEEMLDVKVNYSLEIDYQSVSENHIRFLVQSKHDSSFTLKR